MRFYCCDYIVVIVCFCFVLQGHTCGDPAGPQQILYIVWSDLWSKGCGRRYRRLHLNWRHSSAEFYSKFLYIESNFISVESYAKLILYQLNYMSSLCQFNFVLIIVKHLPPKHIGFAFLHSEGIDSYIIQETKQWSRGNSCSVSWTLLYLNVIQSTT